MQRFKVKSTLFNGRDFLPFSHFVKVGFLSAALSSHNKHMFIAGTFVFLGWAM